MMHPPGLQLYLQPRVTLTFDLPTAEVDRFMSLPRRPLVPILIKTGSIIFKIPSSLFKSLARHRHEKGRPWSVWTRNDPVS